MKQFLHQISLFGFCLLLILFALNVLQSHYNTDPAHYAQHYEEIQEQRSGANAIIIGSSHGVHAYRPSILETETHQFYNFCLNGAGPSFYLNWYTELFSKTYPKPKICIYTVEWFMFNEAWLWRDFEFDSEYFSTELFAQLIQSNQYDKKSLLFNRLAFVKYREQLFQSLQLETENKAFVAAEYDRGYIPFQTVYKEKNFQYTADINKLHSAASEQQAFLELIKKLKADGIQVLFVMTPEYQIDAAIYQAPPALFLDSISSNYAIPYLNFNTSLRRDSLNENSTNFMDWGHLSAQGSIIFSELLKGELKPFLIDENF